MHFSHCQHPSNITSGIGEENARERASQQQASAVVRGLYLPASQALSGFDSMYTLYCPIPKGNTWYKLPFLVRTLYYCTGCCLKALAQLITYYQVALYPFWVAPPSLAWSRRGLHLLQHCCTFCPVNQSFERYAGGRSIDWSIAISL